MPKLFTAHSSKMGNKGGKGGRSTLTCCGSKWQEIGDNKLLKDLIFYSIASSVIAVVAGIAGASLPVILFTSLLIPPVILIIMRILR